MVHAIGKTLWRFLININIKLPEDIAILCLGIYVDKSIIQKETRTPMFTAALFTVAKTQK